ncbi:unnamed protein product [Prorocentrum cordatum]|uniref:AAA+ ATPase domain-containing protein n=1 Tax=Prorocentrum cordatum TaxID=2364126 RepID=A0ABN9RU64_9DINO|nr:unnamed protein product [Polarella glacialis]
MAEAANEAEPLPKWVCPICLYDKLPRGSAGRRAHIRRKHNDYLDVGVVLSCSCRHGCVKCVPESVLVSGTPAEGSKKAEPPPSKRTKTEAASSTAADIVQATAGKPQAEAPTAPEATRRRPAATGRRRPAPPEETDDKPEANEELDVEGTALSAEVLKETVEVLRASDTAAGALVAAQLQGAALAAGDEPAGDPAQGAALAITAPASREAAWINELVASVQMTTASLPHGFRLGVVYGPSGSGKSRLLAALSMTKPVSEETVAEQFEADMAVCSHPAFGHSEEAINLLSAAGLNKIPAWVRPLHSISNGERSRALLAVTLASASATLSIDDFASNTDAASAASTARSLAALVRQRGLQSVWVATANRQVIRHRRRRRGRVRQEQAGGTESVAERGAARWRGVGLARHRLQRARGAGTRDCNLDWRRVQWRAKG